jgi:hypothetical protein
MKEKKEKRRRKVHKGEQIKAGKGKREEGKEVEVKQGDKRKKGGKGQDYFKW